MNTTALHLGLGAVLSVNESQVSVKWLSKDKETKHSSENVWIQGKKARSDTAQDHFKYVTRRKKNVNK